MNAFICMVWYVLAVPLHGWGGLALPARDLSRQQGTCLHATSTSSAAQHSLHAASRLRVGPCMRGALYCRLGERLAEYDAALAEEELLQLLRARKAALGGGEGGVLMAAAASEGGGPRPSMSMEEGASCVFIEVRFRPAPCRGHVSPGWCSPQVARRGSTCQRRSLAPFDCVAAWPWPSHLHRGGRVGARAVC